MAEVAPGLFLGSLLCRWGHRGPKEQLLLTDTSYFRVIFVTYLNIIFDRRTKTADLKLEETSRPGGDTYPPGPCSKNCGCSTLTAEPAELHAERAELLRDILQRATWLNIRVSE